jgi:hypothetical protein
MATEVANQAREGKIQGDEYGKVASSSFLKNLTYHSQSWWHVKQKHALPFSGKINF